MLLTNEQSVVEDLVKNIGYLKTVPINNDHIDFYAKLGIKFGYKESLSMGINRPTFFMEYEDGEFLALQYHGQPKIFSKDGVITGTVDIKYEVPRIDNEGAGYCSGGDYDKTTGKLALAMYGGGFVRVYQNNYDNTFTLLYSIGTGGRSNDAFLDNGGILYYPRDAKWLPNGNLMISSYYGKYEADDYPSGYIMEVSGDDGTPIRKMFGNEDRYSKATLGNNFMYRPMGMERDKFNPNHFYVSEYGASRLMKIDIETSTVIKEFANPEGFVPSGIWAIGIVDDGNTIVRSNDRNELMAQDIETGELKWIKNSLDGDFSCNHGGSWMYGNIFQIDSDRFIMSDWNKNRVSFETDVDEFIIQYAPPISDSVLLHALISEFEIMKIWGAVGDVEEESFRTTVKIKDIPLVTDVLVELRRR